MVLWPQHGIWVLDGKEERRNADPRLLWVNEPMGAFRLQERRRDSDVREALQRLRAMNDAREIGGLVAAALRVDGTLDCILAGVPFEIPDLGRGMLQHLDSVVEQWLRHPEEFEPESR